MLLGAVYVMPKYVCDWSKNWLWDENLGGVIIQGDRHTGSIVFANCQ